MIKVNSEYGKLKRVLLHRPGRETENISPSSFEELLFEDSYYLKQAQKEHDAFAKVFKEAGVEIEYLEDLVSETLLISDEIKGKFVKQFIYEAGIEEDSKMFGTIEKFLLAYKTNAELVESIMAGVRFDDISTKFSSFGLIDAKKSQTIWALAPLPNLIFTRDPFASITNGISLHSMTKPTRKRETIFSEYIFKYHPDYKNTPQYYSRYNRPNVEGGDVMILSSTAIAIGLSERTDTFGAEKLAKNLFNSADSTVKTVYGIEIPKGRAWMHLDTVFTQIDKNKFAIFTNYKFNIFKMTSNGDSIKVTKIEETIDAFLGDIFGESKVTLIQCGGGDSLYAEREQWNDGSNVLAIAPNEIIVYDRNTVTNDLLEKNNVIIHKIPSYELSRGRGGPRCMSMPLERDDV